MPLLSGCLTLAKPIDRDDQEREISQSIQQLVDSQEPISGTVTIDEAVARAILYNIDARLKLQQRLIAEGDVDLARMGLLPQISGKAGLTSRSNDGASTSLKLDSPQNGPGEPSISQDRTRRTAGIELGWNMLDFGISYFSARQSQNKAYAAEEQRRKTVQTIVHDTRVAYWRAAVAERFLHDVATLVHRVNRSLTRLQEIERLKLLPPQAILERQKSLYETLRQVQNLRKDLVLAKGELAVLMGLPPGQDFALTPFDTLASGGKPLVKTTIGALEKMALANRPELLENGYDLRVGEDELRKSWVRLFPGVEVNYNLNYDSNSYLIDQTFRQFGLNMSVRLFDILTGPDHIKASRLGVDVLKSRRIAIGLAVLSQTHFAYTEYREAIQDLDLNEKLLEIDRKRLDAVTSKKLRSVTEEEVISTQLDFLLAQLRRDVSVSDAYAARDKILVSIGADPINSDPARPDVNSVKQNIITPEDILITW